jgi:tRNA(Ile)-lysidine synthase
VPRESLAAFLEAEGQPCIRDPSNEDSSFARVRMRKAMPALHAEGLTASRLAATARRMARARTALERAATDLLARAAAIYPEGYARLAAEPLDDAPEEVGLRALSRLLTCVGGNDYGPRLERLERAYAWLREGQPAGGGRTLAGCRIMWRGGSILVCREAAATRKPVAAVDGAVWDGRFRLAIGGNAAAGLQVGRLGRRGWEQLVRERPEMRKSTLPAPARAALPALWALDAVVAVPHLNYRRKPDLSNASAVAAAAFLPARPLSMAGFITAAGFR